MGWLRGQLGEPHVETHLLVDEGERVIDEVRHHWVAYLVPFAEALVATALFGAFLVSDVAVAWLPLVLGIAVLGHAVWRAVSEYVDRFVVTNIRVLRVWGVFSQRLATIPLVRILDISVEKPFVGRFISYGHFVFESAAQEQGLREIRYVGRIDERDLTIQRVIQRSGVRGTPTPAP